MSALMVNNLAAAGSLGVSAFDASSRIELRPDWTENELKRCSDLFTVRCWAMTT